MTTSPLPNDPLRQRLRTDALAHSPAFSPDLHARTLAALRDKSLRILPSDMPLQSNSRWRLLRQIAIPLTAAAAAAIVAWIVLQPGNQRPAPTIVEINPEKNLPSLTITPYVTPVRNAVTPTAKAFEQAKYGYLDKDAQRLAIFVADQIPTFPPNPPQ